MCFWILSWILIFFVPLQTSPEFVVREVRACCHHRIILECPNDDLKIAIVQARYIASHVNAQEKVAALIDPSIGPKIPQIPDPDYQAEAFEEDPFHHRFIPSSQPSVSLWDLDVKFVHELQRETFEAPFPVNSLPEWHPDHSSHAENRRRFYLRRPTIPPRFPVGKNFSGDKVLEMPVYEYNFLDIDTIWRQPLFPIVLSASESSSFRSSKYPTSSEQPNKCLSYQTLMNAAGSSVSPLSQEDEKPSWNFKDLRAYFNRRCSGKRNCDVYFYQNLGYKDEELAQVCHLMPDGKIVVKYICFNSSAENTHSKCNTNVASASEGFLMNPGYPELYPGDHQCQFRLNVPQQRILLILLDVSLRAQETKRCRDELSISESEQVRLFSTCGDQETAIAVLSESHQLNLTLHPQSRLAFPKRGFLAYYRVIGCVDPQLPRHSYLAFRNATRAKVVCDVGYIFPDSLARIRWLYCSPLDHRWLGSFPFCNDIRNFAGKNATIEYLLRNDPSVWPLLHRNSQYSSFQEIGLPFIVLMVVFGFHGIILYMIWRQRSRLEEIENQRNTEMERMFGTASNEHEEGSIFSFPDSFVDDLWEQDDDETDQDRTTLTLQTDTTPNSSAITGKMMDLSLSFEERATGHFRFFPGNGTSVNNGNIGNGNGNGRPHIGYINGQLLPVTFNGYFRQTAV